MKNAENKGCTDSTCIQPNSSYNITQLCNGIFLTSTSLVKLQNGNPTACMYMYCNRNPNLTKINLVSVPLGKIFLYKYFYSKAQACCVPTRK